MKDGLAEKKCQIIFNMNGPKCPLCKSNDTALVAEINKRPENETDFKIAKYQREIRVCNECGVFYNQHNYYLGNIYCGQYNKATYNNKIKERFDTIMALPPTKSDNKGRARRIIAFVKKYWKYVPFQDLSIFDIGSGLCVFLAEMNKYGFKTYCLDPDPLSIRHAKENVYVNYGWVGMIEEFFQEIKFDIITFNKVLEHVTDPIGVLAKTRGLLNCKGLVYIELPDANSTDYINGEEFFLEHNFIFTLESTKFLIKKAGFKVLKLDRIHEPSGKYTIFAFIQPLP